MIKRELAQECIQTDVFFMWMGIRYRGKLDVIEENGLHFWNPRPQTW